MSGGLRHPKVKVIKIIRADGTVADVITKEFFSSGAKDKYVLYPGDTVYVPSSFEIPWGLISTILGVASLSLSIITSINSLSSK